MDTSGRIGRNNAWTLISVDHIPITRSREATSAEKLHILVPAGRVHRTYDISELAEKTHEYEMTSPWIGWNSITNLDP